MLRQVLDRAVLRGWLTRNPARAVSKLREDRAPIDPFSFDEVKTLLEKGFRTPEEQHYFTAALFTGLRPSEQIAAEWETVDWVSRPPLIGVLAAVSPRGGRGRTKSEASKRSSRCSRWSSTRFESSWPRASCGVPTSSRATPVGR